MRVLLYEYTTGGGLIGASGGDELAALLAEGAAMISAVAADFAAGGQHDVQVLRERQCHDLPLPGCQVLEVAAAGDDVRLLEQLASDADWTLVIAPETGGILADRCGRVLAAGGRLLGPSLEFVELAADKHRTAEHLRIHNVLAPAGCALQTGASLPTDFPYPAVLKPRDGCGSQDVRLIADRKVALEIPTINRASRLEEYVPGISLSVALLCGPGVCQPLPACRQTLSTDGRFTYLGGLLPVPGNLAHRAQALALHAVAALPVAFGYLGMDLVLGTATDGSQDYVIEVNPRLTTSYIGLRAACRNNLATALLGIISGANPQLRFRSREVFFSPAGISGNRLFPRA